MRGSKWAGAIALSGMLVGFGSAIPAWASIALPWSSPSKVTSGVPVHVASIAPCPAVPAGDTPLVQVFLSFGSAGGETQQLTANADGSWSGDVTFSFSGVTIRQTTIDAACIDFNGTFGVVTAQYQTHHAQLFG